MRTVTYDETKWKLVPVTGSLEMIDAFKKEMRKAGSGTGDSLRAAIAAAPDHPATDMAAAIHYPDCWDTAAYPTLESALRELAHGFQCTNDECAHPATAGDAEDAAHREFYAIGRAVTRAALELPPRAELRIYLERGAGTVYWLDVEHGALRHIEGGDLFSTQIEAAIEAMRASKGGE